MFKIEKENMGISILSTKLNYLNTYWAKSLTLTILKL